MKLFRDYNDIKLFVCLTFAFILLIPIGSLLIGWLVVTVLNF